MSLLSVEEARGRILANFRPVKTEMIPLVGSSNRVLAEDIRAADDLQLHSLSLFGFGNNQLSLWTHELTEQTSQSSLADYYQGTFFAIAPGLS